VNDDAGSWIAAVLRFGEPRYTNVEVAERAGVSRELADRLWRAIGFADTPEDVAFWSEEDVRALRLAASGVERLDGGEREQVLSLLLEEARLFSAHLASIAELELEVLPELAARGVRTEALAGVAERGLYGSDFGWLVFYLFRRQLEAAARRRADAAGAAEDDRPTETVAFLDLVGFTSLVEHLELTELRDLLARFQRLTFDAIAESGGRVVKLIGDEVMYVCPTAEDAGLAGLEMLEGLDQLGLPHARGSLATGPMLHQAGDYFGRAVNRAGRLVDTADPGQLLADAAAADALVESTKLELTSVSPVSVKGVDAPLDRWEIRRRASSV
jgi:adenylate cyclase